MGILGSDASSLQVLDFSIRLSVIPLCAASIGIAVTMKQDNSTYGNLDFHNLIGLKYMVCISAVSAGCALFAALSSGFRFLEAKAWLFFLMDQVMAYLMVTTIAAQGEFLYLAYHGDREVSWSEACASYGNFCSRLKVGIAVHVVAVACFLVLAVISAYRLFRKFDPPLLNTLNAKDMNSF